MLQILLGSLAIASELDVTAGVDLSAIRGTAVMGKGDVGFRPSGFPTGLGFWGDVALGPMFRGNSSGGKTVVGALLVGPRYRFGEVGPVSLHADAGVGPFLQWSSFPGSGSRLFADLDLQLGGGVRAPICAGAHGIELDLEGHLLDGRYPRVNFGAGLVFEIGDPPTGAPPTETRAERRARRRRERREADADTRFTRGTKDWSQEDRIELRKRLADVPPELRVGEDDLVFVRQERAGIGSPATYDGQNRVTLADSFFSSTQAERQRVLDHELAHRWAESHVDLLRDYARIGWTVGDREWTFEELNRHANPMASEDRPTAKPDATFPVRFDEDTQAAANPSEDLGVSVEQYLHDRESFSRDFPERARWIEQNVFPPPPAPAD